MCWEQSPLKRTIATSRSEATTTETEPENETTGRTQDDRVQRTNRGGNLRLALPLRSNPEGNRFRLTNSFRNGLLDRSNQGNSRNLRRPDTPMCFRVNRAGAS